jgi:hypothetical protein
MAEIFNALAAKELGDLARFKDSAINSNNRDEIDCERRVVDFLGRAENQIRGHAYSCLIKGFYEIRQGAMSCIFLASGSEMRVMISSSFHNCR